MAGYSARQSSFTTGDTITAAHSNDEFNQVLAAFNATTGHTHDGTAGEGGPVGSIRDADYVEVSSAAVQQLRIQDGAIVPITDNDIDLGTSSLEFKDLYVDGTAYVDAINYNGTAIASTAAELNIVDGDTSATSTTVADADRVVLNDGGTMKQVAVTDLAAYFDDEITAMPNVTSVGTLTTLTVDDITINGSTISDSGDFTIDGGADIILDADGGDVFFKDGGTTFGSATNTSGNLIIKSGTTTALTFSGADVTVAGDLTVSGDDITMGTNTAGNLLIADGTNFNSIAVGSLTEISTVADDDVFLAVDTSGGGLKKIARSAVVSGLATSSAISNVADDSTPQLGGDLDVNSNGLVSTSNGNIALTPNGTGVVRIDGSSGIDIQSGSISIKNSGTQSYIDFYCESSNAHYARLQAPAHSAFSGNITLTLPATTDTVAGIAATQTFTNKTLTSPKINEDVAVTSTATELNLLDGVTATTTELNLIDGGSTIGTTAIADGDGIIHNDGGTMKVTSAATFKTYFTSGVSSAADDLTAGDAAVNLTTTTGNITIDAQAGDADIIFKGTDSSADITALTLDMSDAGTAVFNHDIRIADGGQIGSASDADAIAIASDGVVTFSQAPVLSGASVSAGTAPLTALDIDGGTDIGANLADADLFIVDDGAGGTNRKMAASRIATYVGASAGAFSIANLDIDGGTDIGEDIVDADLFIVDNGAGGTNRKVAASRIKTYIGGGTQWQAVKTSNFTASAGQGVFCNTTSAAFTLTLPASPSIGDEVSFVDYAGTFDTNNLTIGRNSSKIHGADEDLTVSVERAANTLVFTDSTQGWLLKSK